jgi:VanZ family protein
MRFLQKGNPLKFLKYWFPVFLYCCIIFGASAVPAKEIPNSLFLGDKVIHMVEYGILAVLFARAIRHASRSKWALLIWALAVYFVAFYGITDEFHQSFVAGRSSDLMDWFADISGGAIGAAVYLIGKSNNHLKQRFQRTENKG